MTFKETMNQNPANWAKALYCLDGALSGFPLARLWHQSLANHHRDEDASSSSAKKLRIF
jgi:hypothetical protein